jgi:hypothetical protein
MIARRTCVGLGQAGSTWHCGKFVLSAGISATDLHWFELITDDATVIIYATVCSGKQQSRITILNAVVWFSSCQYIPVAQRLADRNVAKSDSDSGSDACHERPSPRPGPASARGHWQACSTWHRGTVTAASSLRIIRIPIVKLAVTSLVYSLNWP